MSGFGFNTLALGTVVGLAGPMLASVPGLRVPVVIGELAVGLLIGRTGLGIVDPSDPTFTLLANVGFALVMFVVGTADTVVYPESSKVLSATVAGSWLVQFKNATHGLMYETPIGFARVVLTFLGTDETVKAIVPPPMLQKAGDGKVRQ